MWPVPARHDVLPDLKLSRWLWLTLLVLILDQSTKQIAEAALEAYRPHELMPFFNFTLMYNKGAAFSFLSDQGGWQRWFFSILAAIVTVVLVVWLHRLKPHESRIATALSLIIGGAVGNLIDRVLFGQVIDFIDVYYKADSCLPGFSSLLGQCHWPAFNIADSAIFIGVALILLDAFVGGKNPVPDSAKTE